MYVNTKLFLFFLLIGFSATILKSQIVVGEYTGDGTASQVISGLGDSPSVLFVIPDNEGSSHLWVATQTILDDFTSEAALVGSSTSTPAGFQGDLISSFDSDGFTVATDANVSSVKFRYVAFNSGDVAEGKFTGAVGAQDINVGFTPSLVWIFTDGTLNKHKALIQMSGYTTETLKFSNGVGGYGEKIFTGVHADGFSVGAAGGEYGVEDGRVYYYVAFNDASELDLGTDNIGYGSGPDKITTSFEPEFMFVRGTGSLGNNTYVKTKDMASNTSFIPRIDDSKKTDGVISFESDGFNIGSTGQLRPTLTYFAFQGATTLPVELISFNGRLINEGVKLTWKTASELNSDYFLVQRSTDGINFETIGKVSAQGNSSSIVNYDFVDTNPAQGNNYYRLKQVDYNGEYEYFKTVVINSLNGNSISRVNVFPNPTDGIINISFNQTQNGFQSFSKFVKK